MDWILVLYIYAGPMAKGDSVTVTNIEGFQNKQACERAGNESRPLVSGTYKELRFVCVRKS